MVKMEETISKIWACLEHITDPEIPVLTIVDMGIVRDIKINNEGVEVIITPTYSGCPAMSVISTSIRMELLSQGWKNVTVTLIYSPAWTTDWMSESGRQKLKNYGIAPPVLEKRIQHLMFENPPEVPCPQCNSVKTEMISEFGSTPCKALMRCKDCLEPFDYFKCHR
jgi:ring-1,2-phenylacetyl-CoA epoxidase subunit PaaD